MATLADYDIDVPPGASGEVRTTCPQCSPQRKKRHEKCLAVNVDKGAWSCKHCGWSGGVKSGADDYGATPPPVTPKVYQRPDYAPGEADALDPKALLWLTKERGLTEGVVRRNRLESRRVWMPQLGKVTTAIAFPYFRDGAVVNVKYRDGAKHFRLEAGAELVLYGLDGIEAGRPLVWVEGEIDKLSCEVVGFGSCVSMPNGAPPVDAKNLTGHFAPIATALDLLSGVSEHIIAVDNDAPGRGLQDELVRRLGADNCRIAAWPEGCKDANDVLVQHGAERLAACLDAAAPVPVKGLFTPNQLAERLNDLYDNPRPGGLPPSSTALAAHYKILPGMLSIVTGIPSRGKSTWLDWLLVDLMWLHGQRFAICSPENQPLERHLSRMLQLIAGKPFDMGRTARMSPEERDNARAWIDEYVTFIMPGDEDQEDYALDRILDLAKSAIKRRGVNGIVLDPWNELEHSRPPGLREDEYLAQSLMKIKRFARLQQVHVWIVAHPRSMQKVDDEYPVPKLGDISGGQMWWNKADVGLVVHRDPALPSSPTQIYIQKVRNQPEMGVPGMVEMWFDPVTGGFNDQGPITRSYGDPWEGDE